jgi:hypothetical protein
LLSPRLDSFGRPDPLFTLYASTLLPLTSDRFHALRYQRAEGKEFATMATKFTPLHDRVMVRQVEEIGTTRGGIIIPDSAKDKPQEG